MWWYDSGPHWLGWVTMTLAMLVFWGVLAFGAVAAYRSLRRDRERTASGHDEPVRLLEERFARGEIDADEFTRRLDLLRPHR